MISCFFIYLTKKASSSQGQVAPLHLIQSKIFPKKAFSIFYFILFFYEVNRNILEKGVKIASKSEYK